MISDNRLRWLSGPDYIRSEPGQVAAELLAARGTIAALEARCQQADAILAIVKRHADDAMADDDVELDGDAKVMMMAIARYYRDYPPADASAATLETTKKQELQEAPMPCPGFDSGACVPGKYCGRRLGYAYPCPGQPGTATSETACEHDWKTFMGSSRQLTVCTKCGAKQETPVESREPMTPDDWEYWPEKPIHSMSVHHRGRIVDGIWRCWDCPATHDVEYAQKIGAK